MKAQDKKRIIDALDQVGRGLVDIAETLDIIKTYIYQDSDKPLKKLPETHNHKGEDGGKG